MAELERPGAGASFSSRRLRDGRRTPTRIAFAWLLILGGVVALGVAGRGNPETAAVVPATASPGTPAGPTTSPQLVLGPSPVVDRVNGIPPPALVWRPPVSSPPGPVRLEAVRTSASLFVHGDVYAADVVWVFISVQTDSGRVAGWASLSFPSSVGHVDDTGPALRFDVELVIPADMLDGRLWAQANVYNAHGQQVGSTRLELPRPEAAEGEP